MHGGGGAVLGGVGTGLLRTLGLVAVPARIAFHRPVMRANRAMPNGFTERVLTVWAGEGLLTVI